MRVLMLGWEFPPHHSGGLGVACLGLSQALVEKGVEVIFVLPKKVDVNHDAIKFIFANVPNIKIRGVDTALTPYITGGEYKLQRKFMDNDLYGSTLFEEMYRYAELVRDIAEEETFDVIHAHDWLSYLAGIEAKKVSGKPLILHVHATSFDQAGRGRVDERLYSLEKYCMEQADSVITVSQFTKDTVTNNLGINPNKVRVVHNGVDIISSNNSNPNNCFVLKSSGKKIVLLHGRITIQKGPDYFIRAAKRVLEYDPNVLFVVSGTGDMEYQVIALASELGISENVIFAGALWGEERDCIYQAADLYVMPSVSEPFGIVPLEALLKGDTPVLISKQSGVSEVLKNALKVDFWDIEEMANKIIAVLHHEPLARQLTEYGKNEARGITWAKAADKCIEIYNDLLGVFNKTKLS